MTPDSTGPHHPKKLRLKSYNKNYTIRTQMQIKFKIYFMSMGQHREKLREIIKLCKISEKQ